LRRSRPLLWIVPLALALAACTPPPGFDLGLSESALAGTPGGSVATTLTLTPDNGFAGEVTLALADTAGDPVAGLTLTPEAVTLPALSASQEPVERELTLAVGAAVANGSYALRITASFAGRSRSADLTLTVADVLEPRVTITGPADGTVVTGSREVTITGTLAGVSEIVDVRADGAGSVTATTFDQGAFSLTVELGNNLNSVVVTAEDSAGRTGDSAALELRYPFLAFEDFQVASVAIGQPDFEGFDFNRGGSAAANTLFLSFGNGPFVTDGGTLFLPDDGNNRILGFDAVPTENDAGADFVLGQADFVTTTSGSLATQLDSPASVSSDGTHLAVADADNLRVLIWNSVPTEDGVPADVNLGEISSCTAGGVEFPNDAVLVDGKLIVADLNNNRVLIWNSVPTEDDTPADIVLGQSDFTSCMRNDDDQDGVQDATPSARTMWRPTAVWSDGERLAVTDGTNSRMLIWTTFPTATFTPADLVIGQPDFVSGAFGVADDRYDRPWDVVSNGNQLFVADMGNRRVLVYDGFPISNGQAADRVLGQAAFDRNQPNDDDQDGAEDANPTARTLSIVSGLGLFGDRLIVKDAGNHRYLIFESP
jgi:hypothetical protein